MTTEIAVSINQPEVCKPPVVPLADGTNAEKKEDGKSSSEEVPVGETAKDRAAPSETTKSEHESPTKKLKLDSATDLQVTAEADENKPPSDSSTIVNNNEEDKKGEEAILPEDKDAAEKDVDGPEAGKDLGAHDAKEPEEEDKTEAEKDPAAEAGKDAVADTNKDSVEEDKAEAEKDSEADDGKDLTSDSKMDDKPEAEKDAEPEAGNDLVTDANKEDEVAAEKDADAPEAGGN